MESYKLGLGTGQDAGKPFDTPTLIEVWRTAPYLHDGRARTIRDVLTKDNPKDRHGATSTLTQEELNDLIEYVLSL
jgi:cytochrome c peroxidase